MRIFGIDPGAEHAKHVTSERGSGWCVIDAEPGGTDAPVVIESGKINGGPDELIEAFDKGHPALKYIVRSADVLLVENFRLLNVRANTDPLIIIGQMQMLAYMHDLRFVKREPRQRNTVSHDDLKRIGMWPGGAGHADEAQAIRHVLAYLMDLGHMGTMQLISPDPGD